MGRYLAIVIALSAVAACSKKKQDEGLPPAQEWSADPSGLVPAGSAAPANPHGGGDPGGSPDMANPHAGVDMGGGGANPHAGVDMGGGGANPHAGVDMGGGAGANPHAGGGADMSQLGLPPPDPNRPIDPAHHVNGVLKIHPKAKDRVKPGAAVFLIVKRADDSGQPTGTPLAVEKVTWTQDGQPFELTEKQAMIAGTQLTGEVVVIAHYDQDGDAISKQPGDVMGQIKVKIPADNVNLFLDDVLQ